MNQMPRHIQPEQPPAVRKHNFDEVTAPFDAATAVAEAQRCLQCKNPQCRGGCPVGVDIPAFIKRIAEGDPNAALACIKCANSLPGVTGRVCPQEEQCEKLCVRARMDGAVAIGALERYAADTGAVSENAKPTVKTPRKRVAVIGSGPSGLACAADCAKAGFAVTVFEAFHKPGGVLVYGIPEFRLPKALVDKEIALLKDLGVTFSLNTVIGKTLLIEELQADFDAIFIGTGAGLPQFLGIPGEQLNGVISANEYLTRVNLMGAYRPESESPVAQGSRVAVFGAGNVAMDAARTAVRMGAESVTIVYRRGRDEMPARREEIRHAEQEGVQLALLCAPKAFVGARAVEGVRLVRCALGAPDAGGRRMPVDIPDSDFTLPCDLAIVAVGTAPNPLLKRSCDALAVSKRGALVVDGASMTSLPGVYAGGDAVTGAATVILAMGAGRKAAEEIVRNNS
ncbi:MAG: NADPH-dependent glutamate synthase [Clostridiales bacterium]|jgi:glutamate synthase (NADPH/NADH) small chain|nr:NADPH-dependent glutamate synthase [Clostridiales bacterium]